MATLLPSIRYRIVDTATGAAIPGAKVYTYAAGTTTPKDSYTSSTAGVANTNPVIADARGEVLIWLSGAYKIRITDADDNVIDEEDNVVDLTSGGTFAAPNFTGTATYAGTSMTWSGNPTHSGNHTFSGNVTINGNTAIGNASGDTLTIAPSAVTWTNGATHSGAHTFSGAVALASTLAVTGATTLNGAATFGDAVGDALTFLGTPAGRLLGGAANLTASNLTNISSLVIDGTVYVRVGGYVIMGGAFSADIVAGSTTTSFEMDLPVASDFSSGSDASAAAFRDTSSSLATQHAIGSASPSSNKIQFGWTSDADTASRSWVWFAVYKVF